MGGHTQCPQASPWQHGVSGCSSLHPVPTPHRSRRDVRCLVHTACIVSIPFMPPCDFGGRCSLGCVGVATGKACARTLDQQAFPS
eukprot:gene18941-biopygen2464